MLIKYIILAALSLISVVGFAQNQLVVEVIQLEKRSHFITQQAYVVMIPKGDLTQVEEAWLNYIGYKKKHKGKVAAGEHFQSRSFNKSISAYPFNIYSKLSSTASGVQLTAWFTQSNEPFISSDPNNGQNHAVQKYVHDFAVQQYRQSVEIKLRGIN
jgi:hypothetical protein